jgi:hypothetical protein
MFARQKRLDPSCSKELRRHIAGQEPLATCDEYPCIPRRRVHRQADKPAEQQIVAESLDPPLAGERMRQASRTGGCWCLIVSDNPDKTFAEAADHIIYQANNYSTWLSAAGLRPLSPYLGDREQLRQSGLLNVVEPDTPISMIGNLVENVPITHFYSSTLPPGLPPRWAQTHLELFASMVIPAFR